LTPTRDGLPPEIFLATLERIKDDVQDRYSRLSAKPPAICPEGKLTRRIARDPDMGMPVRGLVLDEFQEWFDLGDISKDIASLLVYLSKVAPAAGVFLIDATQKPSGIGTGQVGQMFISFRDNHQVRFSLRTASYNVSEIVLGSGAYGEGLDSSTLLRQYKGVGILRGATDAYRLSGRLRGGVLAATATRPHLSCKGTGRRLRTGARLVHRIIVRKEVK
jgi:DNA segregation ATPase FtsK/SpoIIIE, S-DNA-T family